MKVGTADFLRKQIILYKPLQKSETVETLLHSLPIDIPPMSKDGAVAAKKIILSGIMDVRTGIPDRYCSQN